MSDDLFPVAELSAPAGSRPDRRLPLLWIIVGVLLAAGVLAAFLVGDERSGTERVAAAAGAVQEAGSVAYTLTMEMAGPITSTVTIEGAADAGAGRASSRVRIDDQELDLITDGELLYVRVPEEARANFDGKPWVRFDASALGSSMGGVSPSATPLETFEQLREAGKVEEVGTEQVRGVETTRFRMVVDQSGLVPSGMADEVKEALREVEVEVWLDDDDRIRRHRSTIDLASVVPGGGGIGITTTIETYDYGKPVTIDLPPAEDVADGGAGGLESIFAPGPPVAESSSD